MILFIILLILAIFALVLTLRRAKFKKVVKMFKNESCSVFGARGSGKDMLMSNVVAYRNEKYVSNVPYTKDKSLYIPYNAAYMRLGGNTFEHFLSGNLIPYKYPLPDKCDFYISDVGVHFPAQYNDKLDKYYPEIPLFMALARHLGDCNVHYNVQALSRPWLKLREQSERYIYCKSCHVWFKRWVSQKIYIYDRFEAAANKVKPFMIQMPLFGKKVKNDIKLARAKYESQNGEIIPMKLFYRMRSEYDTRRFKKILEKGSYSL